MSTALMVGGLALAAGAAFFALGFWLARRRHRNAIGWGVLTLFLGPIALVILALLPALEPVDGYYDLDAQPRVHSASRKKSAAQAKRQSAQGGQRPRHASRGDDPAEPMRVTPQMRWRFLTEYDPAVRAAVAEVAPLGTAALEELKNAYLMVEDRAMLPLIIARIRERVVALPRQAQPAAPRYDGPHAQGYINGASPSHAERMRSPAPVAHEAPPPAYANGTYHPRRQAPPARPTDFSAAQQRPEARYATPRQHERMPPPATPAQQSAPRHQARSAPAAGPAPLDRVRMPGRFEADRAEAGMQPRSDSPPRSRTGVTATDLVGAAYLETYRDIHLFRLRDGRFYIDKHLAVMSLDQAHAAVDFIIQQRSQRA